MAPLQIAVPTIPACDTFLWDHIQDIPNTFLTLHPLLVTQGTPAPTSWPVGWVPMAGGTQGPLRMLCWDSQRGVGGNLPAVDLCPSANRYSNVKEPIASI